MEAEKLQTILAEHKLWLADGTKGASRAKAQPEPSKAKRGKR